MADINSDEIYSVTEARRRARVLGHLHRVQIMLAAAGLAACGIVAVAAAMMSVLF